MSIYMYAKKRMMFNMLCTLPLINIMFNTHDMGIYVCSNLNENQIKRESYIRESQI